MEAITSMPLAVSSRRLNWEYQAVPEKSPTPDEKALSRFPAKHSCQFCQEDIINAFKGCRWVTFLRDKAGTLEAAKKGCKLYEWLLYYLDKSAAPNNHGVLLERNVKNVGDVYLVRFLIGTEKYSWPCASFDVFTQRDNPTAPWISARPFNSMVDSAASFEVANRWLGECAAYHEECRPPIAGYMPTRLIDLSGNDGLGVVKIISSHTLGIRSPYATLSYCWGGDQSVKTTKSTIDQQQNSIQIDTLGKTLQDAIKVARSLGIPFLWIDSLCIIQDDPEDVSAEISKMLEYYENSYVSICAATASHSNDGFLAQRCNNPYLNGPFELPYRGPDNRLGSVQLAQYLQYCSSREPMKSRAWILQESLLAPRILSYSYRSLAWSCRRQNQNDGGPSQFYDFSERAAWAMAQNMSGSNSEATYMIMKWMELVQSYTQRLLTDPADKLNAISGMAQKYGQKLRKYQERHPDPTELMERENAESGEKTGLVEYRAGLWYCPLTPKRNFCLQLLWSTALYKSSQYCSQSLSNRGKLLRSPADIKNAISTPAGASRRSAKHLAAAPSWSWASTQEVVHYEDWIQKCYVSSELEILGYGVDTPRALTVKGKLGRLTYDQGYCSWSVDSWKSLESWNLLKKWNVEFRPDTWEDVEEIAQIARGKKEGWMLIASMQGEDSQKSTDPPWTLSTPKGLVVVADGEIYRRIGLCSVEARYFGSIDFSGLGTLQTITIM